MRTLFGLFSVEAPDRIWMSSFLIAGDGLSRLGAFVPFGEKYTESWLALLAAAQSLQTTIS